MPAGRAGVRRRLPVEPETNLEQLRIFTIWSSISNIRGYVEQRLKKGLEVLPRQNVWFDPDCGLKTRTVEEAVAKLEAVVSVAEARDA